MTAVITIITKAWLTERVLGHSYEKIELAAVVGSGICDS